MRKKYLWALIICAAMMCSCKLQIVPQTISSVNAVGFKELRLERKDYQIVNTINAEASVIYYQPGRNKHIIKEKNGEFAAKFKRKKVRDRFYLKKFVGVARFGYLHNDLSDMKDISDMKPAEMARHIALYHLIKTCKEEGGDTVIEPIFGTEVKKVGSELIFTAKVSAKVIKINSDKEWDDSL